MKEQDSEMRASRYIANNDISEHRNITKWHIYHFLFKKKNTLKLKTPTKSIKGYWNLKEHHISPCTVLLNMSIIVEGMNLNNMNNNISHIILDSPHQVWPQEVSSKLKGNKMIKRKQKGRKEIVKEKISKLTYTLKNSAFSNLAIKCIGCLPTTTKMNELNLNPQKCKQK